MSCKNLFSEDGVWRKGNTHIHSMASDCTWPGKRWKTARPNAARLRWPRVGAAPPVGTNLQPTLSQA